MSLAKPGVAAGGKGKKHVPESGLILLGVVDVGHSTHDDGSDGPEHLEHLGRRRTQRDGDDLTAVGRRIGDENTPRDTLEQLGSQHDSERVAEVEDENGAVQGHEGRDGGPTISDPARERASEEDTDKRTKRPAHLEGRLPLGLDDHFTVLSVGDTVSVGEGGQGDEVANQEDAVRLHDLEERVSCDPQGGVKGTRRLTIVQDMTKAQSEAMG